VINGNQLEVVFEPILIIGNVFVLITGAFKVICPNTCPAGAGAGPPPKTTIAYTQ
jgi:hypothetical protein